MNRLITLGTLLFAGFVLSPAAYAQANELSVLAGVGSPAASVGVASLVSVSGGVTASVQVDFAHRLKVTPSGALYLEFPAARVLKASVSVGADRVSAGQSQFFFTPGLRYAFVPNARVSPYAVGGFGFGWFDAANVHVNGPVAVNLVEGFQPAAGVGAGVAILITHGLSFRAEVRDFINCAGSAASRNHMVYSGGFGFRF
jgi:opacity protein-like surface antigen